MNHLITNMVLRDASASKKRNLAFFKNVFPKKYSKNSQTPKKCLTPFFLLCQYWAVENPEKCCSYDDHAYFQFCLQCGFCRTIRLRGEEEFFFSVPHLFLSLWHNFFFLCGTFFLFVAQFLILAASSVLDLLFLSIAKIWSGEKHFDWIYQFA